MPHDHARIEPGIRSDSPSRREMTAMKDGPARKAVGKSETRHRRILARRDALSTSTLVAAGSAEDEPSRAAAYQQPFERFVFAYDADRAHGRLE